MDNIKYITNQPLDHGMGSRVLKLINIYGYASLLNKKGFNYEFIYTPFSYEGYGSNYGYNQLHLYSYKPIIEHRLEYIQLCKRWENMLNYSGKTITEYNESMVTPYIHPGFNGESELECFDHTREIKQIIKKEFNIQYEKNTDFFKINIHIRRGDVNPYQHGIRWISDEYYLNIIDILTNKYKNSKLTIYTQRNNFNSNLFSNYDIIYDDEIEDNKAWCEMINSDILVIGKSAFSYSAGILCDGIVIYPSDGMFHPKLTEWKTIEEI
jgi:hypothetical protein